MNILQRSAVIAAACCSVAAARLSADEARAPGKLYPVMSWGDVINCYGPGTDPAMDTPAAVERMIEHWQARGYAGIYMRTDLGQINALIRRNPIVASAKASAGTGNSDPRLSWLYKYIDRVMEEFDFHQVGAKLSAQKGFEWYAWHPHIYSDGAPETFGSPGIGRIWPWTYVDRYAFEHPEIITVDRRGNQYWMVREFIYPGARESKVNEFVHIAKTYGVKRFISCMRSEATQIQDAPDKADRFGFNVPIVEEMKKLHNVDILADPRFDVDSPSFNLNDPLVNKWRDLRGSYVTQFYRDLRKALRAVDPQIQLAVTLSGDHVGPPLGNWRLDWRTWVDEGLIDTIITPVTFEATIDNDAAKKGYLTSVRAEVGLVTPQVLREHISKSKHPQIKVIATNSPPYLFDAAQPGADGSRVDAWYSLYHLAWFQRWWQQCFADVEKNGHIKFLDQNFDGFPVGSVGFAGGFGDARYDPKLRACPGVWYPLGDGSDQKPTIVSTPSRGGKAVKLTATDGEPVAFTGWHRSFPDRSGIYAGVDNAITNGTATLDFWVRRDTEQSGLTAFLQDAAGQTDVGLRIEPVSGKVFYAKFKHGGAPDWVASDFAVPPSQWQKLSIEVDVDGRRYSAFTGDGSQRVQLCKDIAIESPKPRIIEHPNDPTRPFEVPAFKMFRQVQFTAEGDRGSVCYVDDASLQWKPALHYTRPRPKVYFRDDFEQHGDGSALNSARAHRGGMWTTTSDAGAAAFTITNDTSFGDGVKALVARSGGTVVGRGEPLRHIPNSYITVDLDVYVRSDKDYPYIMPDPTATSRHRAHIGLRRKGSGDAAATALVSKGTWWLWDGTRFVDTKVRVAYDAWNHLQIAVDAPSGAYRVVTQPVGEMPTLVGTAKLGEAIVINSELEFFIETSDMAGHLSLYDNIVVTAGSRP